MDESYIKNFVNELYKEADILFKPKEEEFKDALEESLIERIGEESIDMLDDNSKEEYYALLETSPDNYEIKDFFISHIDNFDKKINDKMMDFASEFLLKIKRAIIINSVDVEKYKNDENEEANDVSIEEVLKNKGNK